MTEHTTWSRLTDDAVARLPLHEGRVELLKEIMSTVEPVEVTTPGRRTPSWMTAGAAAAAVLAVVAVPVWVGSGGDEAPETRAADIRGYAGDPGQHPERGVDRPAGNRAVLVADDWSVEGVYTDTSGGEMTYVNSDQRFDINWYPAGSYDNYLEDRQHIDYPEKDPGESVTVLRRPGLLWPYSKHDHTVIREVQDGLWMEFRGTGLDKQSFLTLLGELVSVDAAGFEQSLPDEFVTDSERPDVIAAMLEGIGTGLPASYDGGPITSAGVDRYHLGADVAGTVTCAWIADFAAAKEAGDQPGMQAAADALATSRDWPILREMDTRGDYPEVVWEVADQVQAGTVPKDYRRGLGCD